MKKTTLTFVLCLVAWAGTLAQKAQQTDTLNTILKAYFASYQAKYTKLEKAPQLQKVAVDDSAKTLKITANVTFAQQEFTPNSVRKIYKDVKDVLPEPYNDYKTTIWTNGLPIEKYIPNYLAENKDESRMWGDVNYDGKPWVRNKSTLRHITHGLSNRHLTIWASHGRYYDNAKRNWIWQRPNLFCTTEDLFTQTIVVPFLIPMLENAGAVVFTPRERDWQKKEYIVDNDDTDKEPFFKTIGEWKSTEAKGFAFHTGNYSNGENPFSGGTALMTNTTSSHKNNEYISYQPNIEESGRYAVYVSYQTMEGSIDDAHYTVYHKGQTTTFHVNQQMGGGTWVYLGTFDFDAGCSERNRVVISNVSKKEGVVTTDAVRFGGGMGNIVRGGETSGMPRCLEAARYYAQWAGAPYNIVSAFNGSSDYKDDLNSRSLMSNWIAGGSCYLPKTKGLKVPIELSVAVHSDAGVSSTDDFIGSLSICTTKNDDKSEDKEKLGADVSRMASRDFCDALLTNIHRDVTHHYGKWTRRSIWDKNYNETRRPEVPSAIIETLSHQNFADMRYGHDPNFKFVMARAIYKGILQTMSTMHGQSYVVEPLQPREFYVDLSENKATLHWKAQEDPLEETAHPNYYIVYTATGDNDFDNGTKTSNTSMHIELEQGVVYHFKVTACNKGGESFPTEVLSACYQSAGAPTVLVINGFQRLASPSVVNTDMEQGFDMDYDPGVSYGKTAGWAGRQTNFDKAQAGKEGPSALGYCTDELTGIFVSGNEFNYVKNHATAIATAKCYNIASSSRAAVEDGQVSLNKYNCIDLILGLERNDGYSLVPYKTFTPRLQEIIKKYTDRHGNLLVSGSYVASDMRSQSDSLFMSNVLKTTYSGTERGNSITGVNGLGMNFDIYRSLNERHYAATAPDALSPVGSAYGAMQYGDGKLACIAYHGKDYHSVTMGFPLECIINKETQAAITRGLLAFLMK